MRIFAGDVVDRKKPAPDIYQLAVASLDVDPHRVVVVEDSPIGQAAARAAGLACLVTTSDYTRGDAFPGADLVVSDLGEPGAPAIHVQANPHGVEVGDFVDLAVVEAVRNIHETTTEGAPS
jgi:beta-phosphoglucomutase-like phosphatase (HAD superfamily)